MEHILRGEWKKQGKRVNLEWWLPLVRAYPLNTRFHWCWIRVLGLPLRLWSTEVIKEIGDKCSGWLDKEEETIIVKGPLENLAAFIDVEDGEWSYRLLVWCEVLARYEKVGVTKQ